ncbi:MAG: hypothetical protein GXO55_01410 [Chloroflexi bacterium]|nr:hypothetical protein [Chloroflexota bacterium]
MTRDRYRELITTLLTVEKMVEELEDYIVRDELFRQLIVHTPWGDELPKLSLGGLVERLNFLEKHLDELPPEERERVRKARDAYERFVRQYRDLVAQRFRREFKSYLHSWKWYLDELRENPDKAADYPAEVHNRVRLTTLLDEMERLHLPLDPEQVQLLEQLDAWLRAHWEPGDFVWVGHDPEDYDPQKYWYLYGRPRVE